MGSSNVSCLGSLVAAAEQQHQRFPVLAAVDAIAGSVIDAQLEDTLAYGLPVATQSRTHAVEPPEDPDPGLAIPQAGEPFAERAAPVRGQVFTDFDVGHCSLKRSEEHTSELQSLMRISYAVSCLKKKKINAH